MPITDRWKVRFENNERVDLPDFNDLRNQIVKDFNLLIRSFFDNSSAGRVLKKYEQGTHVGLTFKLKKDIDRSFYNTEQEFLWAKAFPSGSTFDLAMSPNTTNYVQLKISTLISDLQQRAFWNTDIGLTGEEFFDSINVKEFLEENLTSNTVGFDSDAVALFQVVTGPSSITGVTSVQDHFFTPRSVSLPAANARTDVFDNVKDFRLFLDYLWGMVSELKGSGLTAQSMPWSSIKLLREYQNMFFTGGGNISFENPTTNTVAWDADLKIEIAGRGTPYTIDAGSVLLTDGQCAYVDIPEGAPVGSLTPVVQNFIDVPIDPIEASSSPRLIVLFFRRGNKIYSMMDLPELDSGESGSIGQDLPLNIRTRLGIVGENSYVAYTSTVNILANDNYAIAISKIDAALAAIQNDIASEDSQTVGAGGATVINSTLTWVNNDAIKDILVFVNGKWVEGAGRSYNKTGVSQLTFTFTIPEGSRVSIHMVRTGGGGGGGGSVAAKDEGSTILASATSFNFIGAGVTVTNGGSGQANITIPGSGSVYNVIKYYRNLTGVTIPAGKAVAFLNDGSIALADANSTTISDFCGITAEAIADSAYGAVYKSGECAGVLSSLAAVPGQLVYLGETPGELQLTAPTGLTDAVIIVGRAEPPNNVQTATADSLFLFQQVIQEA